MENGDCNIKQKALNSEHAGAEMLIIIRDQDVEHEILSLETQDQV